MQKSAQIRWSYVLGGAAMISLLFFLSLSPTALALSDGGDGGGKKVEMSPAVSAKEAGKPAAGHEQKSAIAAGRTLWEIFRKGKTFMWFILATSICGTVFTLERLIELRRKKHAPPDFEKDVVHLADVRGVEAGLVLCREKPSSLSRVLYAGFLRQSSGLRAMETAIQEEGNRLQYDLRRNCRIVGIMSNIAPLLGLLGTCTGMIRCFDRVAKITTADRSTALASGIGEALLTTAFGLIVAIPLYLFYHFIRGRADDLVREIEGRAVAAAVELENRARRSIRPLEDLNENLETKEMQVAHADDSGELDPSAFESTDQERAIKTSVATPPAALPPVVEKPEAEKPETSPGGEK